MGSSDRNKKAYSSKTLNNTKAGGFRKINLCQSFRKINLHISTVINSGKQLGTPTGIAKMLITQNLKHGNKEKTSKYQTIKTCKRL